MRPFSARIRAPVCALVFAILSLEAAWAGKFADCVMTEGEARAFLSTMRSGAEGVDRRLQELPREVILGKRKPSWQEFEELKELVGLLEGARAGAEAKGELLKWKRALTELLENAPDHEKTQRMVRGVRPKESYAPTEREMIVLYQEMIRSMNRALPRKFRLRIAPLGPGKDPQEIRAAGAGLVAQAEAKLIKNFESTGYPTPEAYNQALAGLTGDDAVVRDAILNEQFSITIRRPVGGRWWIPKVGFHNQHVTQSSRGYLGNSRRNQVEAGYLSVPTDEYSALDNTIKPNYGALHPPPQGPFKWYDNTRGYGEDLYVVDPNKVRDRLTFTMGDSLNVSGYDSGWFAEPIFTRTFIPWKYRALLYPYLRQNFGTSSTYLPSSLMNVGGLPEFRATRVGTEYPEWQIFGGLTLDDVKEFEFTSEAPTGEFLDALLSRNIKIFNRSGSNRVLWDPPKPPAH